MLAPLYCHFIIFRLETNYEYICSNKDFWKTYIFFWPGEDAPIQH